MRRAREGSSEDDPLARFHRTQDRGDGRGLNPAPDECGTRRSGEYDSDRVAKTSGLVQNLFDRLAKLHRSTIELSPRPARPPAGAGGARPPSSPAGRHRRASSRERQPTGAAAGARRPRADGSGSVASVAAAREPPDRRSCSCAARLVRTRFAWSAFASRFARARVSATTARSSSSSTRRRRPRARAVSSIASRPFAYATACRPRSTTASGARSAPASRERRAVPDERDLEVGRRRAGQRAGAEERAAEVRATAARAGDDRARRALERREPRRRARRPRRSTCQPRARRPRRAAGSGSPARRRAGGTSGSPTRRRTRAAARTRAARRAEVATSRWSATAPRPRRWTLPAAWKSAGELGQPVAARAIAGCDRGELRRARRRSDVGEAGHGAQRATPSSSRQPAACSLDADATP